MNLPDIETLEGQLRPGQLLLPLFNTLQNACFFIKDRQRRIVGGNAALVRSLGKSSLADIIGKTDHELTIDFLADAFKADDLLVLEQGISIINKLELVPLGEVLEWQVTTKIPLFDVHDTIIALTGITRKIDDTDAPYRDHPEMHAIIDYVKSNYAVSISKKGMAEAAGISASTLERLFRKTFGIAPGQYARRVRLNAACRLLRDNRIPLAEVAIECGFNDQTNMTRAFKTELNITPLKYRKRFSNESRPVAI